MDDKIFELSPYEIDLLFDSLTQFIDFVSCCGDLLRIDDAPQRRFVDLEYLRDRLSLVRHSNRSTYTGYYSLEVFKKWHSQID